MLNPIYVKIQNFQSIEDVEFEISGFTCLVGKSNVGKSAIIRAITSAILNNSVVGMVRVGKSHATVEIKTGDKEIKWERGEKGINRTTVNGKLYDKTGSNQLEVIKELGFRSVEVGNNETTPWFASQFLPVFLLTNSGSQVTDLISEVSRLNLIQDSITITNRRRKKAQDKLSVLESAVKDDEKTLSDLSHLSTVKSLQDEVTKQQESISSLEDRLNNATQCFNLINDMTFSVGELESIGSLIVSEISEVTNLLKETARMAKTFKSIDMNAKSVRGMKPITNINVGDLVEIGSHEKMVALQKKLNHLGGRIFEFDIDLENLPELNERIFKVSDNVDMLSQEMEEFHSAIQVKVPDLMDEGLLNSAHTLNEKIDGVNGEIDEMETQLDSLIREESAVIDDLSKFDRCPTCSTTLANECFAHSS